MALALPNSFFSHAACVVKAKFRHLKDDGSGCGTILQPQHGIILCHGSIFLEYALKRKFFRSKVENGQLIKKEDVNNVSFSVLLDNQNNLNHQSSNIHLKPSLVPLNLSTGNQKYAEYNEIQCEFLGAFRNNDFHSTVSKIMPESSWTVDDSDMESGTRLVEYKEESPQANKDDKVQKRDASLSYHLMSYFIILRYKSLKYNSNSNSKNLALFEHGFVHKGCQIGQTAELLTTPFGGLCPSVFFNSYSRGVICNISGPDNCWIVTDARCIPGSEGGPLFVKTQPDDNRRNLCGVVVSSLCWKSNEWIGFSVVCSIESILKSINEYTLPYHQSLSTSPIQLLQNIENVDSRIQRKTQSMLSNTVLIQVGSTWGSGVILERSKGIIVTCSHVIMGASSHLPVLVTSFKSRVKHPAKIVFRQRHVRSPYDIAVLACPQTTAHLPHDWTLDWTCPLIGLEVNVLGHAVFSPNLDLDPSLTRGVVSKVIHHQAKPVILQTTCAVHAGASGGPLFTSDGKLVGIVICNTKDNGTNTSFPHVNMSVPFSAIWHTLQQYLQTGNVDVLQNLVLTDGHVSKLWTLGKATCDHESLPSSLKSKL